MGAMMRNAQITSLLIFSLVSLARSDLAGDGTECEDSWLGMAPCSHYIRDDSGHAKLPSHDCCQSFVLLENNTKCLCILIEDRNEPKLGFKFNISLVLNLTVSCKTHTNITECIDLLHLSPNSTEATTFKQFANSSATLSTPLNARIRPIGSGGRAVGTIIPKSMSSNRRIERLAGVRTAVGVWLLHLMAFMLYY